MGWETGEPVGRGNVWTARGRCRRTRGRYGEEHRNDGNGWRAATQQAVI